MTNPCPWRVALVYGFGLSGRAAARLLLSRGVQVIVVDERSREELETSADAEVRSELDSLAGQAAEFHLGEVPQSLPAGVEVVVVSPGVSPDRPLLVAARRAGVAVIAEVELAWRNLSGSDRVIAITGSNGKSTTTAMVGHLLDEAGVPALVCGNIGRPMADAVLEVAADTTARPVFVVELSSFQLETTETFHPQVAALLNVSPDHLDRHGTEERYRVAKERIFGRQQADDTAVVRADEREKMLTPIAARVRSFSIHQEVDDGCFLAGDEVRERVASYEHLLFPRQSVAVPGLHNLENAMAAALMAGALGVDRKAIAAGLESFVGLPHRTERVRDMGGVLWFDDSKGTNMDATARSLEGFEDKSVHLILGGRNKDADPLLLADAVSAKAKRLYLIGEAAPLFEAALGNLVPVESCGDLHNAVKRAAECALPGEVVLLSPACASFDQFDSYAHRGEVFHQLVEQLEAR